ncbi:DUF1349 domain-containing protein [Tunicatimonas pelagia]|uniref:DUF1349 domain-containing protein n=1 Tax=Tunicatimonas pelagia TaxID=931531 RepID=UPI00266563FF|nr:DUF1349 domain-containing protein [Tunicatimonas pelagia]WKN42617.1 DUF1349 domain-containing protein [Tunicatimonas pelagia]
MLTEPVNAQTFRDDFASPNSLNNWQQLEVDGWQSKVRSLEIQNGHLVMEPTSSGWFEDNVAGFLYREYTGNFELTARLKVSGTTTDLPQTAFSLAGLFVRAPHELRADTWQPGQENWMFFSIGSATEPGTPQFEIKSTYQSQSTLKIYPAQDAWVTLKLVRVDEVFTLLHCFDGQDWQLLDQFIRPDLPETLQLGITAYADWPSVAEVYPDYAQYNRQGTPQDRGNLVARFDFISISPTPIEKELPIANLIGEQVLTSVQEATTETTHAKQ